MYKERQEGRKGRRSKRKGWNVGTADLEREGGTVEEGIAWSWIGVGGGGGSGWGDWWRS
jgi:hypothetical protein